MHLTDFLSNDLHALREYPELAEWLIYRWGGCKVYVPKDSDRTVSDFGRITKRERADFQVLVDLFGGTQIYIPSPRMIKKQMFRHICSSGKPDDLFSIAKQFDLSYHEAKEILDSPKTPGR